MSKLKVTTISDPDNDNTALTIDSSGNVTASQGFVPSTQLSHRNLIINGAMQVAQRGTSGTNTGDSQFPSVDRWLTRTYNGTGRVTLARQNIDSNGFRYSVRATPSTTDTSGTYGYTLGQYIEGNNTNHLNWGTSSAQTITLSFWVKSSETGTFSVSFRNGAGDRSWVSSYSISTADTFEYKTITVTGPTDGTWATDTNASILLEFCYGGQTSKSTSSLDQWVTGNYVAATGQTDIMQSTSNYFEITGVQLEVGSVATPFEHRSYGEELALCQRYFQKVEHEGNAIVLGAASFYTSGTLMAAYPYTTTMRATPTGASTSGTNYFVVYSNSGAQYKNSVSFERMGKDRGQILITGLSGTQGHAGVVVISASGAAITLDAELS